MTEVTARPRWYRQTAFRSSLEADWACTLDHLGIKWEYEPREITLPSGSIYIPDFWLPDLGTWIEVKGNGIDREWKPRELAGVVLCHCTGRCECRWYGGEIVLIGREARDYGRTLAWSDAINISSYLARCASCGMYSWRRLRHSLRCRSCREPYAREYGVLLASGQPDFYHADRKAWTAVT